MTEEETGNKSNTWKWVFGCGGGGCLVVIIAIVAFSFFSLDKMNALVEENKKDAARFEEQGYKVVAEPIVILREAVSEKTVFVSTMVTLGAGATADVAIIAPIGVVGGTFTGKCFFQGESLAVSDGAVLESLDVKAGTVTVMGKIKTEITGEYKALTQQ